MLLRDEQVHTHKLILMQQSCWRRRWKNSNLFILRHCRNGRICDIINGLTLVICGILRLSPPRRTFVWAYLELLGGHRRREIPKKLFSGEYR